MNQRINIKLGDLALRAAFVIFLIFLWQAAHHFFVVVPKDASRGALFPSPFQVGQWVWDGFGLSYFTGGYQPPPGHTMPKSFSEALSQVDYPKNIWASIVRLLQGYAIATVIGFPLGLLVARSAVVEKTIGWMS